MLKIGIIGFGKVGGSLYDLLKEKKLNVNLFSETKKIGDLKELIRDSEIVFICVKDDLIGERVKRIKELKETYGKHFVHLSGATPLKVLDPIREKGNFIGKLHPIQTFPSRNKESFKNIYSTYCGSEETYKILKDIFKNDFKIIKMRDEEQTLIHVACVFSSNFPIYLISKAEEILKELNVSMEVLNPIIKASYENVMKKGAKESLTGPAKRKDFLTIKRHKKILKSFKKDFYLIYNYLTKKIIDEGHL
ncbi:MAG: Rossmann-like and DUF2520 domain-containing protein [Candidatus Hydrothermales bacterium]